MRVIFFGFGLGVLNFTATQGLSATPPALRHFPAAKIIVRSSQVPKDGVISVGALKCDISMVALGVDDALLTSIPLNQLVRVKVSVEGCNELSRKGLRLVGFDAQMPAHRHGMVTRAKISQMEPGVFLVEGVKFHMPGEWVMEMKWDFKGELKQVAIPLNF
ncbi:MAG: hypothetical protein NTV34_14210 [Proteobacteria bacterium]|nr:hypothetical protein [Pseudomonadota bacterium]